jgi:multiple sugar transport system substrate-binding protein
MGLNNQNLHNLLFRGFLKPWEAYTGAKITWIDLAQADYNPRLQQAIATKTVDFDILEMGAPFEGDVCGKGLASEMPDWVKQQIDFDDLVNYLKPPVGTWNGKQYRVTIDGDTHNFNYRTDYFKDADLAKAWKDAGNNSDWAVPKTWQQVQEVTKFLKGKKIGGQDAYGYLDACKPWGGFGFYFLGSRATAYAKHPDDKAWLFDADTMKPRVNSPAWVRAIQDVIDALPSEPADQLNADPNTTGFQQFLAGTGSMCVWWGDVGSNAKTNDASVIGDKCGFDILPGSDDVYNSKSGQWEKLPSGPNFAPNLAYLGWGVYVMARVDSDEKKHRAAWSAAAHLGGKDLALWTAAYPSGFQCYRNSQHNIDEWVAAGYDRDFITNYLDSQFNSYNHPNGAIEPRIPGIFQYYSLAEDELANIFAGKETAQAGADKIAGAWEKLTDQIGRDSQIKLYRASLGL